MDRNAFTHPAFGRTVFSRLSAFPGIASPFAAEHAICVRRIRGAERSLVFSQSRSKLSHTAKQKERSRLHVRARPSFCDCTDFTCPGAFSKSSPNVDIFFREIGRAHV